MAGQPGDGSSRSERRVRSLGRRARVEGPAGGEAVRRQTVEFLVMLGIGILLLRTFAAEAYVVPTGSMAPDAARASQGTHLPELPVPVRDRDGRAGADRPAGLPELRPGRAGGRRRPSSATATGCWSRSSSSTSAARSDGRSPSSRARPSPTGVRQAGRRPAGRDDPDRRRRRLHRRQGSPASSSAELRAMRMLVYDNDFVPADIARFPRWLFRRRPIVGRPSGWKAEGTGFVHEAPRRRRRPRGLARISPLGPRPRPIRAGPRLLPVQRRRRPGRQRRPRPDDRGRGLGPARRAGRCSSGSTGLDHFVVTLPVDGRGRPEVRRNGRVLEWPTPGGA